MYVADPAAPFDSPQAQAAYVAAMQTPQAYTALHAVDGPIRCVETHVSRVFLTGTYAYKVKKPLRLSYLDYSTLARREALCREELRLNRRHAPGLYVDVVPVAGDPAAPRVGATDAAPFDYALRMRQFDPQLELTQLLQTHAVTTQQVAALAVDLARLHAAAARSPVHDGHGSPSSVLRVAHDTFDELERTLPPATDRLAALRAAVDREVERVRDVVAARKRDGYVRECHGDLHCGNVVRWRERLVAFDGLEFDPALRFIDVANDVAFLTMDFAVRGRPDLRRAVLDAWTGANGDYAALALLPVFETCRALVRAKVAALRARQAGAGAASDGPDYLGWAATRLGSRAPQLVVMAGLSGSGKTWLARRIAETLAAVVVRSDVERKRLAGLGALERSDSAPDAGLYTPEFNERTYARLRDCVRPALAGGESVVIDAANLRRGEREAFVELAAHAGARATLVHCHAPLEVLRARIAERARHGTDASEATVALLERQPAYWEPLDAAERALALVVDTTQPAAVAAVLRRLEVRPARS